jgi:hypothetical protein
LTAQAVNAGAILGCLDPSIGESLRESLFAGPETVAAATTYVAARLSLLEDGTNFASHRDPTLPAARSKQTVSVSSPRCSQRVTVAPPANVMPVAMLSDAKRVNSNLNEHSPKALAAGRNVGGSYTPGSRQDFSRTGCQNTDMHLRPDWVVGSFE